MESRKRVYLVTYDIADPKRLHEVYTVLKGYGDHIQLSVFRCSLTPKQHAELRGVLAEAVNIHEDQVLLVDLGPDGGAEAISSIGRTYSITKRGAVVV